MEEKVLNKIWSNDECKRFWKADSYTTLTGELRQGKTHIIDDQYIDFENGSGRLMCGKKTSRVPGQSFDEAIATCSVCISAIATRQKQAEWKAKWEKEQEERKIQNQQWWNDYNHYLKSPAWERRRNLVFERANGICEGCGRNAATQAHHLTYDRLGNEMLFDLVAVCESCHLSIHAKPS